jgi:hypothetical protein
MNSTSNKVLGLMHKTLARDCCNVNIATVDWREVCVLAKRQGVLAIVWDSIQKLTTEGKLTPDQLPNKSLKLQWALSAEHIEKRYRKQLALASELSEVYAIQGIGTIVLKGLAISRYYPTPEHRECGDLDCFLVKLDGSHQDFTPIKNSHDRPVVCYDEGNQLAKDAGADVKIGFYKHSHITYKGLMVENHAFCTAVRGSRDKKQFERHLQTLLTTQPLTPIGNSKLLSPCADFNALFLTAHSFQHFLTEGIKLRHVLDWALLLNAEQNNIDWRSFYEWCDKMHFTKFADALTAIAVEDLGIEITNPAIHTHSDLKDKVLNDILYSNNAVHNTKASKFKKRMMIIRNRLLGGWKYSELYEKSAFIDTLEMVVAFFIERKPKI